MIFNRYNNLTGYIVDKHINDSRTTYEHKDNGYSYSIMIPGTSCADDHNDNGYSYSNMILVVLMGPPNPIPTMPAMLRGPTDPFTTLPAVWHQMGRRDRPIPYQHCPQLIQAMRKGPFTTLYTQKVIQAGTMGPTDPVPALLTGGDTSWGYGTDRSLHNTTHGRWYKLGLWVRPIPY